MHPDRGIIERQYINGNGLKIRNVLFLTFEVWIVKSSLYIRSLAGHFTCNLYKDFFLSTQIHLCQSDFHYNNKYQGMSCFSLTVTKYLTATTLQRKDWFWLMVLEILVHSLWLSWFCTVVSQNIMVVRAWREDYSLHGGQIAGNGQGLVARYNLQRHAPRDLLPLARPHHLNSPQLPQIVPPAGTKCSAREPVGDSSYLNHNVLPLAPMLMAIL
jgi:hypothetical protein